MKEWDIFPLDIFLLSKGENIALPWALKFKTVSVTAETGYWKGHTLQVKLLTV